MKMEPKLVTGKNGKEYRFAAISEENAAQYVDLMHQVSGETYYMARYADEISLHENDIAVEGTQLRWLYEDDRQGMFSIFDGDRIIGNIAIRTVGKGRKSAHRCSIGLGVRKEYHGQGLGNILVEHAIEFAKNAGYKCIELGVLSENIPAINLYNKSVF